MKQVLLGLGSNRAFGGMSPIEILKSACGVLSTIVSNTVFSSIYKTKAMYLEEQDDFYNMAVFGFVGDDENPYSFLGKIQGIERKFGRNREKEIRNGPRSLDIDIEFFGGFESKDPVLTVPHPRIKERAFVLVPAIEVLGKTGENLLQEEFEDALSKVGYDGSFRKYDI